MELKRDNLGVNGENIIFRTSRVRSIRSPIYPFFFLIEIFYLKNHDSNNLIQGELRC